MNELSISVAKTLYYNTYRCTVYDEDKNILGLLRVIPGLPLERHEMPEDAPEAWTFLLVIVDDADINEQNLIAFEENLSVSLLKRFATETTSPRYCQFYYPSPAFIFSGKNMEQPFIC